MPLTVGHVKNLTVLDGADTSVVRPSDWNSAHAITFSLAASEVIKSVIVGAMTLTSGSVAFANSNGVSFGMDSSGVITGTVATNYQAPGAYLTTAQPVGAYLTTAAQSDHTHSNYQSTGAYLTTAQPVGAYLTTARASNDGIGLNTALTANGLSVTANSSGLSINVPAFLTTAAQSNHSHGNPTLNLTNLTGTTASGSNGLTLSLSAAAPGGGGGAAISAGAASQSTGTVIFSNASGVSFGLNAGTLTASVKTDYLTTAAQSGHSHGNPTLALTNLTGTTASGSNGFTLSLSAANPGGGAGDGYNILAAGGVTAPLSATVELKNSNGISFGLVTTGGSTYVTGTVATNYQSAGAYLTTAQAPGAYLTTARASNDGIGINSALTANGVSMTANSSGLSLNFPAFLTTAQAPGAYLTTARASNDGIGLNSALTANGVSMTANSSGLSLNFPAFLTTAQAPGAYLTTAAQSDHSHGNPSLFLTGITGTTASASNGLSLSLSAGGGGTTNQTGPNFAVAGTTVTAGTVQFSNLNGLTWGLATAGGGLHTMTASMAMNGTISSRWQYPPGAMSLVSAFGNGSFSIERIQVPDDMIATRLDHPILWSIATSAAANTWGFGMTAYAALYTKNGNSLSRITSGAANYAFTLASNTAGSTQMGVNAIRPVSVPMNVTCIPGEYYVGFGISTATISSGTATTALGLTISNMGVMGYSGAVGHVGDFSATTNTSSGLYGGMGVYSAAFSSNPPDLSISGINQSGSYYGRANIGLIFRNQ